MPSCTCQCQLCRAPGRRHCLSRRHGCGSPGIAEVAAALRALNEATGHAPTVAEIERALPGSVRIDACALSNPYATNVLMGRFRAIGPDRLDRMVSRYSPQSEALSELVAPFVGVPADRLVVASGACEAIHGVLATRGPMLVSLPTREAYYAQASGPVIVNHLSAEDNFRLDFEALEQKVLRSKPKTVVIVTPNSPDGGVVDQEQLIGFLERTRSRVPQVIVDETFGHFASEDTPPTVAHLVEELPHLVVVNSMSKCHGMDGLRLGYAVTSASRAKTLRQQAAGNVSAFAEWFCGLLGDAEYTRAYESARRAYVRATRELQAGLATLPGAKAYPSAANFSLLATYRPARDVAAELLAEHGVYMRDCGDKWGMTGKRLLRVTARTAEENRQILGALRSALTVPLALAVA